MNDRDGSATGQSPDTVVVTTLEQKVLLSILAELESQGRALKEMDATLKKQTRTIKSMNRMVQIIGLIIILSAILGCVLGVLTGPAFLY